MNGKLVNASNIELLSYNYTFKLMLGEYISLMHVISFTLLLFMSMITELLIDTYEFFLAIYIISQSEIALSLSM